MKALIFIAAFLAGACQATLSTLDDLYKTIDARNGFLCAANIVNGPRPTRLIVGLGEKGAEDRSLRAIGFELAKTLGERDLVEATPIRGAIEGRFEQATVFQGPGQARLLLD